MKAIDLHVHSKYSDGTLTPQELVDLAIYKGLKAIALTDHDTTAGLEEMITYAKDKDIEIVPGIELSTEYFGRDIHILGLYINPYHWKFQEHLKTFQDSRVMRNIKMCENLQTEGIDITYDALMDSFKGAVITRAHYARFLLDKGYVKSMNEAFERYVGDHCKAFVPREKITPAQAVELILESGGIPVLAHPILYHLSDANLNTLVSTLKDAGLMGIEAVYSTYAPSEERYVKRLASKYDLLITGGSDFHGSNKKDIDLGVGRGHLFIPEELLDKLKDAYLSRYTPTTKSMLFFDLDGTLLNDNKCISPLTRAALENCINRGHVLAISSGRAYTSIVKVVESLGLDAYAPLISAYNGSQIYHYEKKELLHAVKLSTETIRKIRDIAKEIGIHVQTYSETKVLTETVNRHMTFYCDYVKMDYEVIPDLAKEGMCSYKMLGIDWHDNALLWRFKAEIERVCPTEVQCFFSNPYLLEILPYGTNKGTALKFLCDYANIDIQHSYAFADAENDRSMLEAAGFPLVLLNGLPVAKEAADFITFTDNNHEGLAPFLERLATF